MSTVGSRRRREKGRGRREGEGGISSTHRIAHSSSDAHFMLPISVMLANCINDPCTILISPSVRRSWGGQQKGEKKGGRKERRRKSMPTAPDDPRARINLKQGGGRPFTIASHASALVFCPAVRPSGLRQSSIQDGKGEKGEE